MSRTGLAGLVFGVVIGVAACGPSDEEVALNPLYAPDRLHTEAPATFDVRMETTKGDVVLRVHRDWAPLGADRFYTLVTNGFYDDIRIYRVVPGFMAQFGLNGDGRVNSAWRGETLRDDPVVESNTRGRVAFAKGGPHSRTTEIFISYRNNSFLDSDRFAPFGEVIEGMEVVDAWNGDYGDGPPRGEGPYAIQAASQGNVYLDSAFPALDRILNAEVVSGTDPSAALGPVDRIDGPSWAPDRIAVGDVAPDFRLESYRGDTLQLTDYRGKREVILVFYRGAW